MTRKASLFSREWGEAPGLQTRACKDSPPRFPQALGLKGTWIGQLSSAAEWDGGLRHSTNGVEDPDTPSPGVEDPDTPTTGVGP